MAKQTPILDKSFGADAAITSANLCMVASATNPGNVKVAPIAAGTIAFLGVSNEPSQTNSTSNAVSCRIAGIAQIQSDGAGTITAGDYVGLSTTTAGQVVKVTPAFAGTNLSNVVGIALSSAAATAGALVDVFLQPQIVKI